MQKKKEKKKRAGLFIAPDCFTRCFPGASGVQGSHPLLPRVRSQGWHPAPGQWFIREALAALARMFLAPIPTSCSDSLLLT